MGYIAELCDKPPEMQQQIAKTGSPMRHHIAASTPHGHHRTPTALLLLDTLPLFFKALEKAHGVVHFFESLRTNLSFVPPPPLAQAR